MSIIKKCLLIGINYVGTSFQLNGCINDSYNIKNFLISKQFFEESQFIMMNDNQKGPLYPTKNNIINKFDDLVRLANQNKTKTIQYFIAYSGHGSNLPDNDGDEDDGFDECLCPIDCDQNGFISDDYIRTEFIEKLPKNVSIVTLIDACHSGTILDLKYNWAIDKKNSYNAIGIYKNVSCNVVMISGCKDNQTSADAYLPANEYSSNDGGLLNLIGGKKQKDNQKEQSKDNNCDCTTCNAQNSKSTSAKNINYKIKPLNYQYNGAMTAAFLACYKDNITYEQIITNIRKWLNDNKFTQLPQLSSSNPIDTKGKFMLLSYK